MHRLLAVALLFAGSGCSLIVPLDGYTFGSSGEDASTPLDAGLDAAVLIDAGTDAGDMDGGLDAGPETDAGSDAGPPPAVVEVSLGDVHACARLEDDSIWCWGSNEFGQLGDGTMMGRDRPREIALANVAQLDLGVQGSCARLTDATVQCWGQNLRGEVGDGTRMPRSTPTAVMALADAIDVDRGWENTCAVRSGGSVVCWGSHDFGGLPGRTEDALSPYEITGVSNILQVGDFGPTCAVDSTGDVYCWGRNNDGQLGDGTTFARSGPVLASGASGMAVQVESGAFHACVRTTDNRVLCFGRGDRGEVGNGMLTSPVPDPTDVSLSNVTHLAVGWQHACVIRSPSGSVLCWGRNDEGQLGDGSTMNKSTPGLVTLPTSAVDISAGENFTCAALSDGTLWCWGANGAGQLGNGGSTGSDVPVRVEF